MKERKMKKITVVKKGSSKAKPQTSHCPFMIDYYETEAK